MDKKLIITIWQVPTTLVLIQKIAREFIPHDNALPALHSLGTKLLPLYLQFLI